MCLHVDYKVGDCSLILAYIHDHICMTLHETYFSTGYEVHTSKTPDENDTSRKVPHQAVVSGWLEKEDIHIS